MKNKHHVYLLLQTEAQLFLCAFVFVFRSVCTRVDTYVDGHHPHVRRIDVALFSVGDNLSPGASFLLFLLFSSRTTCGSYQVYVHLQT